jgi:hypothetical protein
MISIDDRRVIIPLRIYVSASLIAAAVFSSPVLAFVPIVLLVWYLYLRRWPASPTVDLLTEYFTFLALVVLLSPQVGSLFATLIALPVMVLVDCSLRRSGQVAVFMDTAYRRRPTDTGIILLVTTFCVLGISLLSGNMSLLIASAVVAGYLGVLYVVVFLRLPLKPVEEIQIYQRMVAGSDDHLDIELTNRTVIGGQLLVVSPYEWLKVGANRLSLKEQKLVVRVSLSPSLAGPSIVKLIGYAVDRWGLLQVRFELEPIRLFVIPRARYAVWLTERYLATTKPGALPLMVDVAALRPIYGLRRGIEYYGSQQYQPGDSLKNIDWKHSYKYNELIVKEFAEFHGQSAVIMVNLAVGNAEEADQLAYKIMVTALTLARGGIPAALAAYDNENVILTTATLAPRRLLLQCLQIAREMITTVNPVKYLNPPDVTRLRANIGRVESVGSKASEALLQLLQLEYRNLDADARLSPATKALSSAFTKVSKEATVVVISHHNHDAGALAFLSFNLARRGTAAVVV